MGRVFGGVFKLGDVAGGQMVERGSCVPARKQNRKTRTHQSVYLSPRCLMEEAVSKTHGVNTAQWFSTVIRWYMRAGIERERTLVLCVRISTGGTPKGNPMSRSCVAMTCQARVSVPGEQRTDRTPLLTGPRV